MKFLYCQKPIKIILVDQAQSATFFLGGKNKFAYREIFGVKNLKWCLLDLGDKEHFCGGGAAAPPAPPHGYEPVVERRAVEDHRLAVT